MKLGKPACAVFVFFLTSAITFGQADSLKSQWPTSDMKVDGLVTEWPSLVPVSKELAAAAANDDSVLRLVIATSDPKVRQRLAIAGLMVYIDPTNKKAETFGIRVPPLGGRPQPGALPADPRIAYLEVFGPEKDERNIIELPALHGIDVAAGNHEGTWILELSVPLRVGEGRPYAPGVPPGQSVVELGLVTPDPPRQTVGGDRGRGSRGGGGGSRGGRGGGSRGGMPPGGDTAGGNPDGTAIKVWTTIELARSGLARPLPPGQLARAR